MALTIRVSFLQVTTLMVTLLPHSQLMSLKTQLN
jgi:hypothetical protein